MYSLPRIERFNNHVKNRYEVYHNMFLNLPFDNIGNTGTLLPLFTKMCEEGFDNNKTPIEIVNGFFDKHYPNIEETEQIGFLFRYIQYIERQVVLFDAIEDAAFPIVNNMEGTSSVRAMKDKANSLELRRKLRDFLQEFQVRIVLTAHPTQFYPGPVLGIITDLTEAIRKDDLVEMKKLLSQLAKTPFFKKEKPTPFDEAVSLIWYLESVFYSVIEQLTVYLQKHLIKETDLIHPVVQLGFWPGGDRDGNPFVTPEITKNVAFRLRTSILKCYYFEIRKLKRKLTFKGVEDIILELEQKLYQSVFYSKGEIFITEAEFKTSLLKLKQLIIDEHQSLYVEDLNKLIFQLHNFGFFFASLDIRQNSSVHLQVFKALVNESNVLPEGYFDLSEGDKINTLANISSPVNLENIKDEVAVSTLKSIEVMREIQQQNGEKGCNRYIISNNESALHVLETLAMFHLIGWEHPTVDIVPLFEFIDDLDQAAQVMKVLYENPVYKKHLERRNKKQTIMMGFSDGTKDGGYLMANWAIYKAKESISKVAAEYGIEVVFFDGRGGPPARGGGKTHKFYASLGSEVMNKQIQLTIQGQTISSNFGTFDSCRFNIENLISAGAINQLYHKGRYDLTDQQRDVFEKLSLLSREKYDAFKNHPKFIPYLEKMSPLPYYAKTNIGSRPAKRNADDALKFEQLRAIPFVGSWSQLKQNVPGFYGLGTALKFFEDNGQWDKVESLYNESLFFRTLVENSMMAICKSFFPLTSYMKDNPEFGDFWNMIHDEFQETQRLLLKISNSKVLMENYPDGRASIAIREKIVLPLLAIQQYALLRVNALKKSGENNELMDIYEKMVVRSLFGNINASRNSA
ncbi:MAG: phosphoenolpyruvate carboxylase [Flavobacterium sp.]